MFEEGNQSLGKTSS